MSANDANKQPLSVNIPKKIQSLNGPHGALVQQGPTYDQS